MSYGDIEIKDTGKYLKVRGDIITHIHIVSRNSKTEMIHFGEERTNCAGLSCHTCKAGDPPKQRFLINVFDRKANRLKVYEFGANIARSIKDIAKILEEDNRTVHDVDFKIKAQGSGIETRYTVMQVPKAGECPVPYKEDFDPLKDHAEEPPIDEESPY